MHKFAYFNNTITDAPNLFLPAVSPATFYGRGVFTTVAVYNSKPFAWEKHWQRLNADAKVTGIDLADFKEAEIKNSFREIINRNNLQTGRARITFFDESAIEIWKTEQARKTGFLITTADFRRNSGRFRLTASSYPINSKSPLAGVKSCNYLENLLALEEAKRLGFDEAIRLNENAEVVSAVMANVFWIKGKEIFTPPLETGALNGTTRSFVLENFPVTEKRASLDEFSSADEVFLTSAGIGVAAVESINKTKFGSSTAFSKIKEFFDDLKENSG